jgi:hypothetical protein
VEVLSIVLREKTIASPDVPGAGHNPGFGHRGRDPWLLSNSRALESAAKRQVQELSRFQLELRRFVRLVPDGSDAQSLLFALAPFGVLIRNISEP